MNDDLEKTPTNSRNSTMSNAEFETPSPGETSEVQTPQTIIPAAPIFTDDDETEYEDENDPEYSTRARINDTPTRRLGTRNRVKYRPFQLTNFAYFTEPASVNDAEHSEHASEWKAAMDDEMNSHRENNTWTLVEPPKGVKTVKGKWVFKRKCDENGEVARYKARFVAKGYSQRHGIDYHNTFAPVVRYASIRFLIAFAVKSGLKIHQLDVVTAFLQGDLEEVIYMDQPDGYNDGSNRVCRLNKAIYGLRQASRQWNIKLDEALKEFGLGRSKNDPCIYFSPDSNLIVAVYVDDFLVFYLHKTELHFFIITFR